MFFRPHSVDELTKFEAAIDTLLNIYGGENVFAADNLITLDRQMGFGRDAAFTDAFRAEARSRIDQGIIWRLHVLCWAGKHALNIPGDFVECGVYEGVSSAVLARYLDFATVDKKLWLYDLFDHDFETSGTRMAAHSGKLEEKVADRFAAFPNTVIVQGLIPDSFAKGMPERISYFHLDLNHAESETAALMQLFDRMSPGGLLILDDYGWKHYPGQKAAADQFAQSRGHTILELPTGQGLLIKR